MPGFAGSFEQQQGCKAIRASHHQHHQNSKQDTSLGEGIRHRQQRTADTFADYALIVPDLQWKQLHLRICFVNRPAQDSES